VIQLGTGLRTFAHLQVFLKNFIKIRLIIKECPEEIFIKLAIVWLKHCFYILLSKCLETGV
jgi:hypothetical protein